MNMLFLLTKVSEFLVIIITVVRRYENCLVLMLLYDRAYSGALHYTTIFEADNNL